MRYFLDLSYKGTNYHGWQQQLNAYSVQEEVEKALSIVFRTKTTVIASGRTDTGVHAVQQMVHLDVEEEFNADHVHKLNKILPQEVSINAFYKVKENANARYNASSRKYEYFITKVKNPFRYGLVYYFNKPLDVEKMNQAAAILLKHKNFQSFSKVKTEVNNFLCDIRLAHWEEKGNDLIFHIEANRFLRGMVRAIVGTMLDIGQDKISLEEFESIILKKDRREASAAAPPQGLYLVKINYPEDVFL